ncbi:MAG: DUF883 domain-containing protein [Verrucomicrobia bacterium]|nr:DUF883 domain-containing protein [Verrucomicrobiota bacterium]
MENTTSTVATEKLVSDLKVLVHDGEELLKAGTSELTEKGREARAKLAEALHSARETCQKLEQKAVAGAKAADKAIREHPYESVGVAFCVGLLIGVLVSRK